MHEHKSTNPKGLTPLRDWIIMAERPASLKGCNNGVVVLGSIVSVAENKKLVKARCMSMLMRLCVNACKCFSLGFARSKSDSKTFAIFVLKSPWYVTVRF